MKNNGQNTYTYINILFLVIQDCNSVEVADKFGHATTNKSLSNDADRPISYKHSDNREVVEHGSVVITSFKKPKTLELKMFFKTQPVLIM